MADKPIQELFGETLIEAFRQFARQDLTSVAELEANTFAFIDDVEARRTLAETLYGARWIYKLGLALLVTGDEQMAHVRAQVVDYAAICEDVLRHCISHAIRGNHMAGQKWGYEDTWHLTRPIPWNAQTGETTRHLSLYWYIDVAHEEGIINDALKRRLHALRLERNSVHLRTRTRKAFLSVSKSAFETLLATTDQVRAWMQHHA
jgi:hypothetical protein